MMDNSKCSAITHLVNRLDPLLFPDLVPMQSQINAQILAHLRLYGANPNVWVVKKIPEDPYRQNVQIPAYFGALAHGSLETAKAFLNHPDLDREAYGMNLANKNPISPLAYLGMNVDVRDQRDGLSLHPVTIELFSLLGSDARQIPDGIRTGVVHDYYGHLDLRQLMHWGDDGEDSYSKGLEALWIMRDLHTATPRQEELIQALRDAMPEVLDNAIDIDTGVNFADEIETETRLIADALKAPAAELLAKIRPEKPLIPFDAARFDRTYAEALEKGVCHGGTTTPIDRWFPLHLGAMIHTADRILYALTDKAIKDCTPSTLENSFRSVYNLGRECVSDSLRRRALAETPRL